MKRKLLAIALAATVTCSAFTGINVDAATNSVTSNAAISADDNSTDLNSMKNTFALKKATQYVSPLTAATYTHADAFNGMNVFNGVDVSYHRGTIDWTKVAASGLVDYAIIRVGYRGYGSTGALCADPKFEENIQGAIAAGIPVGVYYYTEAISTDEAIAEANYCLDKIKTYNLTLPVYIDFEPATNKGRSYNANLSKEQATSQVKAFCDTISAAGFTPGIYANKSDLTSRIDGATLGSTYTTWLAHYTSQTDYTGPYDQWQYSSAGTVDGISGQVNSNFLYTSAASLGDMSNATSLTPGKIPPIANQKYTGAAITPPVTVTFNGQTLVNGTDYRLIYSNNTAVGTASVTARGIGAYKGTITRQFKIVPSKVTSFKKKGGSKRITLSWAKNASATGYQIYRKATYNAKTYTKVKTISKNTTTSWINKKLAYNREYFYAIRSFTKVNGVNYYSDYTYLTGATNPCNRKATVMKKVKLYKLPTLKRTKLATVPKRARVTYIGRTYVSAGKKVYHIKYKKGSKSYTGYISSSTKIYY